MRPALLCCLPLFAMALGGCATTVARDAPSLLSADQVNSAIMDAADTTRGARATSDLAWRGAQLRSRAARMMRSDLDDAERRRLLRRADELKER